MPDPTAAKYDYAEGLHKTLIFFESMRSGVLDRQRLAWWACLTCCKVAFAVEPCHSRPPLVCWCGLAMWQPRDAIYSGSLWVADAG